MNTAGAAPIPDVAGGAGWPARWHDGQRAVASAIRVTVRAGDLVRLADDGTPTDRWPLTTLRIGERGDTAPRCIGSPRDGWTMEVDDTDGRFDAALRASGYRPSAVERWLRSGRLAVVTAAALVALVVALDRVLIGWAAQQVVPLVPTSVDRHVGEAVMRVLDPQLEPSRLDPQRRTAIEARWAALVARHAPGVDTRLAFHGRFGTVEFNAFASPDGTIVLLDGLAARLSDDEVIAVLAHELGHVVHRHGLRAVLHQAGLLAMAGVVWSDVATLAATTGATLQGFAHSRDAEREADAYARDFLDRAGIPRAALAGVWRAIVRYQREGVGEPPAWLSTHPPTEERLRDAGMPRPPPGSSPATP